MSYTLSDDDLKNIQQLSASLKEIIILISDRSDMQNALAQIREADAVLESKNSMELMSISSLLYNVFSELDQGDISEDLDMLMHDVYVKTVGNKIFRHVEGVSKKILKTDGEKSLINFINTDEGAWQPYEDKVDFLAFISPLDGLVFKPWNTGVKYISLPFYSDILLVEILHSLPDGGFYWRHFIKHKKGWLLDEKNGSLIDHIHKYEVPFVNLDNIMDYVKFYQFFTYSETGRGILIEGENSEFLKGLSGYYKSIYLEDFQAPSVKEIQHPHCFEINFRSVSGDGMSDVVYHIYPDGGLEFIDLKYIGSVKPFPY